MTDLPLHYLVAIAGALLGFLLGVVLHRTRFCTLAAIAEAVVVRRFDHLRAWVLAACIALVSTQGIMLVTRIPVGESIYLGSPLFWLGAIVGGLLFGVGMVLASGCALRSFVHAGSGDLRALVTLVVMALFAYITMRGLLQPAQQLLREYGTSELSGQSLLIPLGLEAGTVSRICVVTAITLPALVFCFGSKSFRTSLRFLMAATTLGLAVPAAWLITGVLGFDEFEPTPLSGLSFVQPAADSVLYLMTWTGSTINFGIALVGALLIGAWVSARLSGGIVMRGFESAAQTRRYLLGGALMGIGGVLAGGCTLGQGLTGIATLSIGSFLALASLSAGAIIAIRLRDRKVSSMQGMPEPGSARLPMAAPNPAYVPRFNPCGN